MKPHRDLLFDIYRGIAIFLVLLGHGKLSTGFYNFIFSFHVGLFFIGKGFFVSHEATKYSLSSYIKNLFSKLVVPYVLVLILNLLIKVVKKIIKSQPLNVYAELDNFIQVLGYPHHTNLERYEYYMYVWFVPLFIITSLALFVFIKYFNKYFLLLYGTLLLLVLIDYIKYFHLSLVAWWGEVDKLPLTLLLSMTGVIIVKYRESLLQMPGWLLGLCSGALLTSVWFQFDMRSGIYPTLALFMIYMFLGCICVLKMSQFILGLLPQRISAIAAFIGRNSLIIYIAHAPIYYTLISFVKFIPSPFLSAIIFNIIAISLSIMVPVLVGSFQRFLLLR